MKSKTPAPSEPKLYDVTAVDDTMIRRTVASGLKREDARFHVNEIRYAHKRCWWNPRIRKHKEN